MLYIDDTLIVDRQSDLAGIYMQCILDEGQHYGLTFNWDKLSMININCHTLISKPDGEAINPVQSIVYLGGVISSDGYHSSEINRRIGLAMHEFSLLQKIWSHANLTVRKKISIYHSLVVSKLMYALDGIWLNQCQRRRLDSFHVSCIRRIIKIQHAYFSRFSNDDVLKAAKSTPLSLLLLRNQLKCFSRIASLDSHNCVRSMIFEPDTYTLKEASFLRRRGRPRLSWASEIFEIAVRISGSLIHLQQHLDQYKC